MKKSTIYQELKNQFIYFFVAYEILKTNNLKLFAVLFLLLLIDVIYNSKNIIQGLTQINTSSELDTTSDLKKSKLNRILIAILFFGICFLTYVLLVRKDFWILLF
jgi:hypothetical protein